MTRAHVCVLKIGLLAVALFTSSTIAFFALSAAPISDNFMFTLTGKVLKLSEGSHAGSMDVRIPNGDSLHIQLDYLRTLVNGKRVGFTTSLARGKTATVLYVLDPSDDVRTALTVIVR
jgi:hypothetical protein